MIEDRHKKNNKINLKKEKNKDNKNIIDINIFIELLPDILETALLNSKTIFEHLEAFFKFIIHLIKEIN